MPGRPADTPKRLGSVRRNDFAAADVFRVGRGRSSELPPPGHRPGFNFIWPGEACYAAMIFGDRQMKRPLCALVTMLLAGTTALAADLAPLPYRTPPPVFATVFTWTGLYVGGTIGGAATSINELWRTIARPAVRTLAAHTPTMPPTTLVTI